MVCSSCGFENPRSMRFCGMCGTPLPHAPLTAPGAQSTLNFTRVPVEAGSLPRERGVRETPYNRAVVSQDIPTRDAKLPSSVTATTATAVEDLAEMVDPLETGAVEPASEDTAEPAAKELVPDVPFEEYVHNFHYEPPSEPTEITMRGDASVAEKPVPAESSTVATPGADGVGAEDAVAATVSTDGEVAGTSAGASDSSVESRLGLDAESPREAVADRPRFLDISQPVGEAATPSPEISAETSTIVGPSFLGLSDPPELGGGPSPTDYADEETPRRTGWRMWLAAGVVVVFVALGLMEWQSQIHQTDNGPVQIIKTKVRSLTKSSQSQNGVENAPAGSVADSSNSKPDMQVQEQAKPQAQNQASNPSANQPAPPASVSNRSGSAGGAVAPTAAAATAMQPNKAPSAAPAVQKSAQPPVTASAVAGAKAQPPAQTAAANTKPPRAAQANDADATPGKPAPGADELAKAKNASDSAAEAAWLWKSTAKGNPDAPVLLADMYMKGDGVPRSCEQAVVLLKTAAEKENARARNRLASMYATGNCVQRNRVEAYRWLSSALVANPHSDWAQQNKNLIWQQMTPEEQTEAQKYR